MTTTDLAVQANPNSSQLAALAPTPSEAVNAAIEQWVSGLASSVRGAEYIIDTPMCPDSFWPLPPGAKSKAPKQMLPNEERESYLARRQVAAYTLGAVVRYGLQLGLPPEVAVQGIFTIGGRMAMYAEQMVALIKSRGHGHRVVERTAERCIVEVRRFGDQEWKAFEFTFAEAIQAGYVPRQGPNPADPGKWPDGNPKSGGGNEKYLTLPATMLYNRASSIACRTEFPDVLRGLISYEEMQDEVASTPVTITVEEAAPSAKVTAAEILARPRPATPSPSPVPEAPTEQPAVIAPTVLAPAEPQPEWPAPITEMLWRGINDELRELGVNGDGSRQRRLAIVMHLIGRTVLRGSEMTLEEGRLVYDTLRGGHGPQLLADVFGETAPGPIVEATVEPELPGQDAAEFDPTAEPGWDDRSDDPEIDA